MIIQLVIYKSIFTTKKSMFLKVILSNNLIDVKILFDLLILKFYKSCVFFLFIVDT